ncbi:D-alanine--D-alanine ligase [bacterium]|nr:D-alanine--D-alanine ligase [bacterium]
MRIAVIYGGTSAESEVSRESGKSISRGLRQAGHQVHEFDISESEVLRKINELKTFDVVFIGYHGGFGEDGRIQAILEVAGIKFTGSGSLASALGMNKILSKIIFEHYGIPTPRWSVFRANELSKERLTDFLAANDFEFPLVTKPECQGSTVGVTIVNSVDELADGIKTAGKFGENVIVEEYIPGKEISVGILGKSALPPIEIVPQSGFYDYKHKYTHGLTEYICPAPLADEQTRRFKKLALKAFNALGCRGYGRVDFRLSDEGEIYCLEVNTLPGMTDLSLVPMAAKAVGIDFPQLLDRIVELSLEGGDKNV